MKKLKRSSCSTEREGYVIVAGYNGVSGYTVVMDHGLGVRTYYFHMSKLSVAEGDFAEEGSEIGQVGSTGYATGPHLHFNVMVHDNSIDPWATFTGTSSEKGSSDSNCDDGLCIPYADQALSYIFV